MTRLSVNINKFATLRNARGANLPDVIQVAKDCERFGAQGITVHPRPDERHIRYKDVLELSKVVTTEFNIEGFPDDRYLELIAKVKPHQATLVPDKPTVLTSSEGWDVSGEVDFLKSVVAEIKKYGARVSLFIAPDEEVIPFVLETGADRIELYTGPYAHAYAADPQDAVKNYVKVAAKAAAAGLGINAGHDLNLRNLGFLRKSLPQLDEVSIGHALICDAIYLGLENTIQLYLKALAK